ncbi:tRNA lysidine(34) synthetase TilS [Thalassotalea agariperforans]
MMSMIEQHIFDCFSQFPNKPIYLAYSGGVDSQVLLHAAAQLLTQGKLTNPLMVCHIHHGLSDNADRWLAFAEQQSQHYQSGFLSKKVQLMQDSGESLEALARDARYQALVEMTEVNDVIATGHHNDDQAETFLLALKRGSGLTGLAAMKGQQAFYQRQLVRPLLAIPRQTIEAYADAHQLTWIEDESNHDNRFDRNFLRNDILPLLTERWPAIKQTIARSAEHCRDAENLILEVTEQDYQQCCNSDNSLSVSALLTLSPARFNLLIRYFLKQNHGLMPSRQQLVELAQQLKAACDKTPAIKIGNYWLRRYQDSLYITPEYSDLSQWQRTVDLNELSEGKTISISLPDQLGEFSITKGEMINATPVSSALANSTLVKSMQQYLFLDENLPLTLTFSHDNPKCLPDFRDKSRSLKKVLQELNIAPWLRKRQLFLMQNSLLVGVAGQFICQPFQQDNFMKVSKKFYIIDLVK